MNNILTKIKELREIADNYEAASKSLVAFNNPYKHELLRVVSKNGPELLECLEEAVEIINKWPNGYKPDECAKFLEKWELDK